MNNKKYIFIEEDVFNEIYGIAGARIEANSSDPQKEKEANSALNILKEINAKYLITSEQIKDYLSKDDK